MADIVMMFQWKTEEKHAMMLHRHYRNNSCSPAHAITLLKKEISKFHNKKIMTSITSI